MNGYTFALIRLFIHECAHSRVNYVPWNNQVILRRGKNLGEWWTITRHINLNRYILCICIWGECSNAKANICLQYIIDKWKDFLVRDKKEAHICTMAATNIECFFFMCTFDLKETNKQMQLTCMCWNNIPKLVQV